jgi:hypothetical protein
MVEGVVEQAPYLMAARKQSERARETVRGGEGKRERERKEEGRDKKPGEKITYL